MSDRLSAMAELYRRGKLPQKYIPAFEEAKKRGLIPGMQTEQAAPQPKMPEVVVDPRYAAKPQEEQFPLNVNVPEEARQPKEPDPWGAAGNLALDVGHNVLTAVGEGVTDVASIPRWVQEMGEGAADWVMGTDPDQPSKREAINLLPLPSKEGMNKIIFGEDGERRYEPENMAERFLQTGVRYGTGGAIAGPVGAAAGVASGIAGQGAEEAFKFAGMEEYAPYAHMIAALAGGAGASMKLNQLNNPIKHVRDVASRFTPDQWARAQQIQEAAQARGIQLTAAEALEQATGSKSVSRLLDAAAQSRGGGHIVDDALANRPAQIAGAVDDAARSVDGRQASQGGLILGERSRQAATSAIDDARNARSRATRPHYDSARGQTVPQQEIDNIIQQIDDTLQTVAPGGATAAELNAYRQSLLDMGENPNAAQLNSLFKATRTRLNGVVNDQNAVAQEARGTLGDINRTLRDATHQHSAGVREGAHIHADMTPVVEHVKSAFKGASRAQQEQAVKRVTEVLTDPAKVTPREIRGLVSMLHFRDPTLVRDLVGAHLRRNFDQAAKVTQEGVTRMSGANLVKAIYGTPQQRENFIALLESIPTTGGVTGQGRARAFERLMEVLEATGKAPKQGSQTQGRQAIDRVMRGGGVAGDVVRSGFRLNPGEQLGLAWQDMVQNRNFEQLARALTDTDSVRRLRNLALTKPTSDRAQLIALQALTVSRGQPN